MSYSYGFGVKKKTEISKNPDDIQEKPMHASKRIVYCALLGCIFFRTKLAMTDTDGAHTVHST